MSMLDNIKAMVAQKTSFMETRELLLGDQPLMESLDDSIILNPYMEAEDLEEDDKIDLAGSDEDGNADGDNPDLSATDEEEVGGEDPMDGPAEDSEGEEISTDPLSDEVPDDLGDGLEDAGTDEPAGEEPLPLPGDDLPEPVGAQTGEPINTDEDIMSMELGMGSDTPRDVLPIPPANAADAIAGDSDSMMQAVDSGFGGNTMQDVGPMDGTDDVMGIDMDSIPDTAPDGNPTDVGSKEPTEDTQEEPAAEEPGDDLSMESVEEKIKKDVEHEEKHKAKVAEASRKSADAHEPFGEEGYLFDMSGHPIQESSEEDLVFDPFGEGCEADTYDEATPGSLAKKPGKGDPKEADVTKSKTEGYDFDTVFDPFSEAIELGGDPNQQQNNDQQQQQDQQPAQDGQENEVTAAVKDKVNEADGGQQPTGDAAAASGPEEDGAIGGLDFGSDDAMGGTDDLGGDLGGTPTGGVNPENISKMLGNVTKIQTDIAKLQGELAQLMVGQ